MSITDVFSRTREEERQAQHERQKAELARAIIASKEEIPRNELDFGPRWIEHTPTGFLYWTFGGDPSYAPNVHHYYVREDGTPVMIEPADPPSRAEIEKRQAAKKKRRADREADLRRRRDQLVARLR